MTLAGHRVNDRDSHFSEHGRKGKNIFKLERAASFGRKGHVRRTYSVQYVGSLRNTDRLTKESLREKNCPILGKAYMFKG